METPALRTHAQNIAPISQRASLAEPSPFIDDLYDAPPPLTIAAFTGEPLFGLSNATLRIRLCHNGMSVPRVLAL